jgi:hypothetical protein
MMFMAYSVGQIIAPHFFLDKESPRYPTGFRAFYVCVALMIAIEIFMMLVSRMIIDDPHADKLKWLFVLPKPETRPESCTCASRNGRCTGV